MPTVEPLGPLYSQVNPPGIVRLSSHLLARFPGTRSGGWYNPSSSLSGGGPSPHRVTQALDVMCSREQGAAILRYMVQIAESVNLQQCIAWHEIVSAARWREGIRHYAPGDHSDGNGHAHIAIGLHASREWTPAWIGAAAPPPAPKPRPAPVETIAEATMQTIHYPVPGQDAFHTFWIDVHGHLRHAWEPTVGSGGGYEDLTTGNPHLGRVNESLVPNRGLSVYIGPKLELIVRGVVADGACCEWRWPATGTGWQARIIGRT